MDEIFSPCYLLTLVVIYDYDYVFLFFFTGKNRGLYFPAPVADKNYDELLKAAKVGGAIKKGYRA